MNEWILIDDGNCIRDKIDNSEVPTIWMSDVVILSVASNFYFAQFDLRCNDKKWIEMTEWTTFIEDKLKCKQRKYQKLQVFV